MAQEFRNLHDLMVWMKEEVRKNGLAYYQVCDLSTDFMKLVGDTEVLQSEYGKDYVAKWWWAIRESGTGLFGSMYDRDRWFDQYGKSVVGYYAIWYENGKYFANEEK